MGTNKVGVAIVLEATLGGIRKHVVDLLNALTCQDFDVTFIYSMGRADDHFKHDIEQLKTSGIKCVELPMTKTLYSPINIYCVFKISKLLRSNNIEIVHLHGAIAGAVGRIAALFNKRIRKIIYSPHGGVLHKIGTSLSGKFFTNVEKALTTKKVFFVAVSADEREKIQKYFSIPNERIFLIPNGIDIEDFQTTKYVCSKNHFFVGHRF